MKAEDGTRRVVTPPLIGSGWLINALRTGSLAALLWLIVVAWNRWGIADADVPDPLMYTNLGNLLFWVLWMMGLVLLTAGLGRVWCGVCPLGAVNEWVSRWGLARPFPRPLRNSYPAALLLLATLLLIGLFRIHHYPGATAYYLLTWLAAAIVLGVVFKGRSLCAHLCPIGGMLNLYSRVSPLELTVKSPDRCSTCEGKECVRGAFVRWRAALGRLESIVRSRRHPCPVNLSVWEMKGSGRCLLCLNCLRACPYDNVGLAGRLPLSSLIHERYPRLSEVAVASVVMGFLLLSYIRFWPRAEAAAALPVTAVSSVLGLGPSRTVYLVWIGFLVPMLLILIPSLAAYLVKNLSRESTADVSPGEKARELPVTFRIDRSPAERDPAGREEERILTGGDTVGGLMATTFPAVIPLLVGAHLVLAVVKLNAKAGYLGLATADPAGVRSYLAVEELGIVARPAMVLPMAWMKAASALFMATGLAFSLIVAFRICRREGIATAPYILQIALVGLVLGGALYQWLF